MSRDYAKVIPSFWTGDTGKWLRKQGADCQVVALYLLTCPSANMIGLYYLPLPTLCHETGMTSQGASKALARLSEGGFAAFDPIREEVWVPEMARFQIGESLKPGDNQIKGIERLAMTMRKSRFLLQFVERYASAFYLSNDLVKVAKESPSQGPSKGLRSQEQEQEQEQEKEQDAAARFDFEAVYNAYPGTGTKAKGIEHLERLVKTQALYDRVLSAAKQYAAEEAAFKASGSKDFRPGVPNFSTWCNQRRWEDFDGKPKPAPDPVLFPDGMTPHESPATARHLHREALERGYANHQARLEAEGRS